MSKIRYTTELAELIIRIWKQQGYSLLKTAKFMRIPKSTLTDWVWKFKHIELEEIRKKTPTKRGSKAEKEQLQLLKAEITNGKNGKSGNEIDVPDGNEENLKYKAIDETQKEIIDEIKGFADEFQEKQDIYAKQAIDSLIKIATGEAGKRTVIKTTDENGLESEKIIVDNYIDVKALTTLLMLTLPEHLRERLNKNKSTIISQTQVQSTEIQSEIKQVEKSLSKLYGEESLFSSFLGLEDIKKELDDK